MSLSNLGLDAFEIISELGTIVLAAQKLGVTQTALTQRIKSLEYELQCPLFVRSRKGMNLTHEGKILLKYCLERRQRETFTVSKIKGLVSQEPRRIRISGPTLQTQTRLLDNLSKIKKALPELFFTFDIDDSNNLLKKLKNEDVDLIITNMLPSSSIQFKKLNKSEFALIGPYQWKGRNVKEIVQKESIIDFNSLDTYTMDFLKRFDLLPYSLPERHYINSTHQMLKMVEMGLGYAVFDLKHVKNKILNKDLINLAPKIKYETDWYLCWNNLGEGPGRLMQQLIDSVD